MIHSRVDIIILLQQHLPFCCYLLVTSVVSTISGWFGHFISFESQFGPLNQKSFSLTIEIPLVPRILGKDFGQLVRNAM